MPASKVVRSRGSVMAVTASAEVMFGPQGQVTNWTRQFSNRVTAATRAAAPSNKRPTWGHEPAARGKSLKNSFTSNTEPRPSGLRVFAAVGSSARYSAFVDQGTGIYADGGGSPWEARVLPPTAWGGSNLYEATWRPAGPDGAPVAGVMIKGQRPQHFFAEGLNAAFRSVGMATVKVPSASLSGEVDTFPEALASSVTAATEADAAFNKSLEQWREWRDAAWSRNEVLGEGSVRQRESRRRGDLQDARRARQAASRAARKPSAAQRTEDNRVRQARRRARLKDVRETARTRVNAKSAERDRFVKAVTAKFGGRADRNSLYFEGGYWFMSVRNDDGGYRLVRGRKVD